MAVTERQGQIGTYEVKTTTKTPWGVGLAASAINPLAGQALLTGRASGLTSTSSEGGGSYSGSLLDFNVGFKGNNVSGTYNPSQGGGSTPITQNADFVQSAKDLLGQNYNYSLGAAQTAVSGNQSANPFFGEFFNYYLGLAQERQLKLQQSLGRKDMLTGGSAASMTGGSLL